MRSRDQSHGGRNCSFGANPDAASAETCFRRALEIARKQKAKSWELRAATSIARLLHAQGNKRPAHEVLAPIYGWFTQGFDSSTSGRQSYCSTSRARRSANECDTKLMILRYLFECGPHRRRCRLNGDALQPMQVVRAALDNRSAGSDDLVARALAILEQGTMRNSRSLPIAPRLLRANLRPRQSVPDRPPAAHLQLQRRVLSDGADCFSPIRYFDVQCLVTSFLVAPGRASELVAGAGAGLQAVLTGDWKSNR